MQRAGRNLRRRREPARIIKDADIFLRAGPQSLSLQRQISARRQLKFDRAAVGLVFGAGERAHFGFWNHRAKGLAKSTELCRLKSIAVIDCNATYPFAVSAS